MHKLLAIMLLFVAGQAMADANATYVALMNGCGTYTLCNAEDDTTAACDNGFDNIIATLGGRYSFCAYITQSDATSITCNLYTSDSGYSATQRQALTSSGAGSELSATQQVVCASGAFNDVWAECSTITGGGDTVTMTLTACPLTR